MMEVVFRQVALIGTILCVLLGILVIGSLMYNPRLWLQDYPKHIRDKVPALSGREKAEQRLLMIPFLLLVFGLPFLAVMAVKAASGGELSFSMAYLTAMGILQLFNLFDALVLDYLILTVMKPRFMIVPGTTRADYALEDLGLQARNFAKGVVICALLSIPIALAGSL